MLATFGLPGLVPQPGEFAANRTPKVFGSPDRFFATFSSTNAHDRQRAPRNFASRNTLDDDRAPHP